MILCRLTVTQVQCGTFELAERQDNLLRRGRRERGGKKKDECYDAKSALCFVSYLANLCNT